MALPVQNYLLNKTMQLPSSIKKEEILIFLYNSSFVKLIKKYNLNLMNATKKQLICILNVLRESNPIPCLIKPDIPCNKYSLEQLDNFWQSQCKDLQQFAQQRPTTKKQYCSLLNQRLDKFLLKPVYNVPSSITKLIKKVDSKNTSSIAPKAGSSDITIKNLVLDRVSNERLFKDIYANTLEFKKYPFSLNSFKQASYNKNLRYFTQECFDWLKMQNEYLLRLPWDDKLRIIGYTHGGDKILNSYILGSLDYTQIYSRFSDYRDDRIFPLAFDFFMDSYNYKSSDEWMYSMIPEKKRTYELGVRFYNVFDDLHPKQITFNWQTYETIYRFVDAIRYKISEEAWERWIKSCIVGITQVINDAPSTPKSSFFVYRGVNDSSFLKFDSSNVFTNDLFMSTSLKIDIAYGFKNPKSKCCVFEIKVNPNSKCLFISPMSYYPTEYEILFAPGQHLLKTKQAQVDSNDRMLITNFTLLN
jgi:hypothetical protein